MDNTAYGESRQARSGRIQDIERHIDRPWEPSAGVEEQPIKIDVEKSAVSDRKPRSRKSGFPWILATVGLLAVGGIIVGLVLLSGNDQSSAPAAPKAATVNEGFETAPQPTESPHPSPKIADDGESLWVSPTQGVPLDASYLLPGTQLILHVRVADLLSHSEGDKVLAALGPWGQKVIREISISSEVDLSEIETLLLGICPTPVGELDYCLRLRLNQNWSLEAMSKRVPMISNEAGFYGFRSAGGRACHLSIHSEKPTLVSCAAGSLETALSNAVEAPLFAREMQRVLQRTDATRMATLVFAGKFLQISGEKFTHETSQPLLETLIDFLGDEATATALSAHWDENFFLELQSTVALNERPHRFAKLLAQRVAAGSDQIEEVIFAQPLHPYGRKVLARFPAMLRKLGNYTRGGEDAGLSVLRCYLPLPAGHNLLMATELLLNSPTDSPVAAAKTQAAEPQAIRQRLQQTTSLVFPKETLQRALEMLSEDLSVPIEIAGRDLHLEGITKNQSFALDLRNRPAEEILLAVLQRANPDQTASGPRDVKQKLVYVVRNRAGQGSAIVVTTRSAAHDRNEKLPAVFEATPR